MISAGSGWGVLIVSHRRLGAAVSLLVGLAGAAIVLLGDQAGAWLWVWDYLRWVSWPVRIGLALAILAISLPAVQATLMRAWRCRPAGLPAWPLIPLSGLLFWLLRENTYRGDALLKLQLLSEKTLQTDPYVWKEPLDALAGYTLTRGLRPLSLGPDAAVAMLSVAAGMIYVAATLEGSRHLGLGPARRLLLVVGLAALGTSQLWFGHVENYSLVTALSMVATALALGYLAGARPLWGAGLAAGAAVAAHPQAIFTLPALLLLLDRRRWPRQVLTLGVSGAVVPLLTVIAFLAAGVRWPGFALAWAGDGQIFWTLRQALAPQQLLDALNNLWLVAPALPLILAAGIGALTRPALRGDRRYRYALALAAGLLLYNFTFQNELSRPRDWDLFAIVGPGVTLWGLYAWLSRAVLPPTLSHSSEQIPIPGAAPQRMKAERSILSGAGGGAPTQSKGAERPSSTGASFDCTPLALRSAQDARSFSGQQPGAPGRPVAWGLPILAFAVAVMAAWVGVNHTHVLLMPAPGERDRFVRYRAADLLDLLPGATVAPDTPFCPDPAADPLGCRRVTPTAFVMPQNGDTRPVIFAHAPARVSFPLDVPRTPSFLWTSPALDPLAWGWGGDGVTFRVTCGARRQRHRAVGASFDTRQPG